MTTQTQTRGATTRLRFRAMGTDAEVIVVGDHESSAELAQQARARIDQLEQRWSRFLVDSEVSRLNRCAGTTVIVSDDTAELVRLASPRGS